MPQFHEGQEVEVASSGGLTIGVEHGWRKAKIVRGPAPCAGEFYDVQFPDGTCALFDTEHIREVDVQHDAHMGAYWRPARDATVWRDPFTGKPEFSP